MEPRDIIVWTGVIIFVITATLTLLDLAGIRRFKSDAQRRTLFGVLIVSIVSTGATVFKESMQPIPKESKNDIVITERNLRPYEVNIIKYLAKHGDMRHCDVYSSWRLDYDSYDQFLLATDHLIKKDFIIKYANKVSCGMGSNKKPLTSYYNFDLTEKGKNYVWGS